MPLLDSLELTTIMPAPAVSSKKDMKTPKVIILQF